MTKPKIEIICAICETIFYVQPSRASQYATCSDNCRSLYLSQKQIAYRGSGETRTTNCVYCQKSIKRKPSQIAKYPKSYCNRICKKADQIGKPLSSRTRQEYPCETCGKIVTRTAATKFEHVFCSHVCSGTYFSGEQSPAFRDGHKLQPYATGFNKTLRNQIKDRDGYQCRICYRKSPQIRLTVHHIDWGKTNHDPENLLTLCDSCHQKVHRGTLQL